jgi:hypothetical protein
MANITLKKSPSSVTRDRLLLPVIEFIKSSITNGAPANIFILIDTHSDAATGYLQHTAGKGQSTDVIDVSCCIAFVSVGFINAVSQ